MTERVSQSSTGKLLPWSQFYKLLIFFAVLIPIAYVLMFVYRALLVPFFLALFFTYMLIPIIDHLSFYRVPRVAVVSVMLLFTFASVGVGVVEVLPYLYNELLTLMHLAPKALTFVNERAFPVMKNYIIELGFSDQKILDRMFGDVQGMVQWSDRIQDALTSIWRSAPQVVGTLLNIIMTPLITFFLIKDEKKIVSFFRDLTPVDLREPVRDLLSRISYALRSAIMGQVTVAAILGCLYVIGFSAVGLNGGIAIGLVAGLCRLIPYLDVIVGGGLSLIVIIANWQGASQLFLVVGIIVAVQSLDGMFITPRIVGERLGIHPLVVIMTVLGFGDLWGFWGILLAVPALAVLKVFFRTLKPYYLRSKAYGFDRRRARLNSSSSPIQPIQPRS